MLYVADAVQPQHLDVRTVPMDFVQNDSRAKTSSLIQNKAKLAMILMLILSLNAVAADIETLTCDSARQGWTVPSNGWAILLGAKRQTILEADHPRSKTE